MNRKAVRFDLDQIKNPEAGVGSLFSIG